MEQKSLNSQVLPQVEIDISSRGITLSSTRFTTPRFVPYDQTGKCCKCKGTEVEIDFAITKDGVTLWCTRLTEKRFVPFDWTYELPGHCFFKIRNRGRVLNVPYGSSTKPDNQRSGKRKLDEMITCTPSKHNLSTNLSPPTAPLMRTPPPVTSEPPRPLTPPDQIYFDKELQQFYDSLMFATVGLPSSNDTVEKPIEEKTEEKEIKEEVIE